MSQAETNIAFLKYKNSLVKHGCDCTGMSAADFGDLFDSLEEFTEEHPAFPVDESFKQFFDMANSLAFMRRASASRSFHGTIFFSFILFIAFDFPALHLSLIV